MKVHIVNQLSCYDFRPKQYDARIGICGRNLAAICKCLVIKSFNLKGRVDGSMRYTLCTVVLFFPY